MRWLKPLATGLTNENINSIDKSNEHRTRSPHFNRVLKIKMKFPLFEWDRENPYVIATTTDQHHLRRNTEYCLPAVRPKNFILHYYLLPLKYDGINYRQRERYEKIIKFYARLAALKHQIRMDHFIQIQIVKCVVVFFLLSIARS